MQSLANTISPSFEIRSEYFCPSGPLGGWWACQQHERTPDVIWVVSGIADQRTIGTTSGNWWKVAYPLQIRWKDSDTSRFYPAAVSATATAATATTAPPATTEAAGPTVHTVVGLAVALGVVILLGIVAFLVYRRRHRRQLLGQGLHTGVAELPDSSLDKVLPSQQTDFRDSLVLLTLGILRLRIDIRSPSCRFRLRLRGVPLGVNPRM